MAKQTKTADKAGRVKIRLVEFEVEGNDQSIQESLKSIAAALNRGGSPAAVRPVYLAAGNQSESEFDDEPEEDVEEMVLDSTIARSSKPAKKIPSPIILDINFNETSPSLKDFVAQTNPKQVMQKYLVVAYWYKHTRGISDLAKDHFFTAFRHMKWTVPNDPGSPIRDLRHKRRTLMGAGSAPGTSMINHIGENTVIEMINDKK